MTDKHLVETDNRAIMLQIAAADDTHRMWERRWQALMALSYHNTRFADQDGEWPLSDFIAYAGEACGFTKGTEQP
jgi:hypothetical protein